MLLEGLGVLGILKLHPQMQKLLKVQVLGVELTLPV